MTNEQNYYKIGYISPRLHDGKKIITPLCQNNTSCLSRDFSMCRYPNSKWQARVYYPRYQTRCNCDKYLYTV